MWSWILRLDEWFRLACQAVVAPLSLLFLRWILAFEYIQSGLEKYHGENWFADLMASGKFPFPFNVVPADTSWFLATWIEIVGGVLLIVGLGTRYTAAALLVLTWVAAYSVHFSDQWQTLGEFWQGYVITDMGFGNFKLPLLFLIMFFVLLGFGAGKLSLDHWVARRRKLA